MSFGSKLNLYNEKLFIASKIQIAGIGNDSWWRQQKRTNTHGVHLQKSSMSYKRKWLELTL